MADKSDEEILKSVVGRRIVGFFVDSDDEGIYTLILDDGRRLNFSSTSPDITHTDVWIG